MLNRRDFLYTAGAATMLGAALPAIAMAPTDKRLIIILQRGAQDGLHALPPYADPAYYQARPGIGLSAPGTEGGAIRLDGLFGLHPEMTDMAALFAKEQLIAVPAVATRYRRRSHFDGQDFLENGSGSPTGLRTGFLNRALDGLPQADRQLGLAVGLSTPLILRGDQQLRTFAPSVYPEPSDQFMALLTRTYERDPAMAEVLAHAISNEVESDLDRRTIGRINRRTDTTTTAEAVAPLLLDQNGPRVTVIESQGWDTHNSLSFVGGRLFRELSATFAALEDGLRPVWDKTLVLTISEFGRSVVQNGGNGSDHGTGGTMFLAGGAVRGGRIVGDWPGLRTQDLYQERDVYPTTAVEAVLKAALIDHLGVPEGHVEDVVFPNSRAIRPIEGLFRA